MEKNEKNTQNSMVISFIENTRKPIIVILVALILIAIILSVVVAMENSKIAEGLNVLDSIEFRYESLDNSSEEYSNEQSSLLKEAITLSEQSSGVVKVRSLLFSADVNFDLENWSDARDLYVQAYEADTTSYTAPLALYNAAISSEEMVDLDGAVSYLTMAKNYEDFSLSARALFNLARIEDTRGNYQIAADTYQELNDNYPSTSWANLAKSRLIVLKSENKAL